MSVHNPDVKRLRALNIVQMKITGHSNAKIAKELNLSVKTVERELTYAHKARIFVDVEQRILQELVPRAIEAIKAALEDGDSETALDVLKSIGALPDVRTPKTEIQSKESDELQLAIAEARNQKLIDEGTVDGEIVNGRKRLAGLLESGEQTSQEAIDSEGNPVRPGSTSDSAQTETGNK